MITVTRETHETPRSLSERLLRAGGTNRLSEANFRAVWGGNRPTWIGGKWTDHDDHGNMVRETVGLRRVPKYLPVNRWHIERWTPPEKYGTPEQWYEQTLEAEDGFRIPALGPYPSRGEYEHCFTLSGASGEFIPLTATACDWIVRAIEWARRQPRNVARSAILQRELRKESEWNCRADDILDAAF